MEEGDTRILLSGLDPLITGCSRLLRAGGSHSTRKQRCRSYFLLLTQKEVLPCYCSHDQKTLISFQKEFGLNTKMDPQNLTFPTSKAEKWDSLTNKSKHSLSVVLLQARGLKSLQSVRFLGIYVPPHGSNIFLYALVCPS